MVDEANLHIAASTRVARVRLLYCTIPVVRSTFNRGSRNAGMSCVVAMHRAAAGRSYLHVAYSKYTTRLLMPPPSTSALGRGSWSKHDGRRNLPSVETSLLTLLPKSRIASENLDGYVVQDCFIWPRTQSNINLSRLFLDFGTRGCTMLSQSCQYIHPMR